MIKVDTIIFLLNFSGINRPYGWKSTYVLFLWNTVCYKFYNNKWKSYSSLQEYSIITW